MGEIWFLFLHKVCVFVCVRECVVFIHIVYACVCFRANLLLQNGFFFSLRIRKKINTSNIYNDIYFVFIYDDESWWENRIRKRRRRKEEKGTFEVLLNFYFIVVVFEFLFLLSLYIYIIAHKFNINNLLNKIREHMKGREREREKLVKVKVTNLQLNANIIECKKNNNNNYRKHT